MGLLKSPETQNHLMAQLRLEKSRDPLMSRLSRLTPLWRPSETPRLSVTTTPPDSESSSALTSATPVNWPELISSHTYSRRTELHSSWLLSVTTTSSTSFCTPLTMPS